ncbi:Transposable element Tcb2 transposase [Araneus ventricosus]|uniref:Transposable element Tcb2 transposase n=1 Tax=Araneus ventricosus TaxID=182803 RepID=A0A4Y2KMN1_ARAVE|nr:Transposable element Tcb2 transposase [Araneus ventricosus]
MKRKNIEKRERTVRVAYISSTCSRSTLTSCTILNKNKDIIKERCFKGTEHAEAAFLKLTAFVKCSCSAVVNVYNNWKNQEGAQSRRANCETPRAINDRCERRLRRLVKSDRRVTVDTLTAQMNQQCSRELSRTTVQRTLLRIGLRSRRLISAPMLTSVHRKKRRAFALQHKHWTLEQWEKVAFSDESRFLLHWIDGRWRICRETSENKLPETIVGRRQGGGGNVMVWVMFSWHALGPLNRVEGTLNSCVYLSIVADQVHPYMATMYPANDGVFQQDNATCHVSKIVRAWFEEYDEGFQLLPWPPNSPDLNHCQNLWEHLDRHIRQKDPPPRNLHELRDDLLFSWSQMPVATFQVQIESMTRSLTAVLTARGGYKIGGHNNVTRLCV